MWISLLLLLFPTVMPYCGCMCASFFECPKICRCSAKNISCNSVTENATSAEERAASSRLAIHAISLSSITSYSFDGLRGVHIIEIAQSVTLETIEGQAFNSLLNLTEIIIQNTRSLVHIRQRAFNNLPKLKYLSISNTGIAMFPDMTSISSLVPSFMLDISDNLHLRSIPPNAFIGMTTSQNEDGIEMNLYNNGFREIQNHAFNGTKITKLILKNNINLRVIHREAFKGAVGPVKLDVSSTVIETLPSVGLESLQVLEARGAFALKRLPPLRSLESLGKAHLTYPSHCCALLSWDAHRETPVIAGWSNDSTNCEGRNPSAKGPAVSASSSDPLLPDVAGSLSEEEPFGSVDFQYPGLNSLDFCQTRPAFKCTPEADAFNPCEDIAGFGFLRVAIWFINVLAIAGNLTVLLVFFASRCKLTVPRFLMCHLAFADFCIGIYLLMIAAVDLRTRGHYSQHAIEWQTGVGCAAAGFLSVFGGELSIYTLSAITLERWHTITHALRLESRLGLAHAAGIMAAGWLLCLGVALLPLVGVSSYGKVSVCLPVDIETPLAQSFVILLLLFNVAAFLVVCVCYARIYAAIRHPEFPGRSADAKIAKRMAVLVFTDFLCMAPISFFAISAAFKVPLITVTNSKILLVLFYPINSCANPFLYAIFTKAFRKDAYMAMSSMGCCESKASMYRVKTYCSDNVAKSSSTATNTGPRSVLRMPAFPHQKPRLKMEGVRKDG